MTALDIMLERETANDETATVVAVFVKSGTLVEKDDVLFDIENSKATQEVVAPEAGLLTHGLEVGQSVQFGVAIAHVLPSGVASSAPAAVATGHGALLEAVGAPAPALVPIEAAPVAKQHVSHAAAALIAELGLVSARFATGFVTSHDVRAHAGIAVAPAPAIAPTAPRSAPVLSASSAPGTAVSNRKRAEIEALGHGAGATMLSVLGVNLGAMEVVRSPDEFLAGRITDLVIYEASRLMRKYPLLNAAYADGMIRRHEPVHAGLAIDGGGQLVVYGIENADRLSLPALAEAIVDAVGRYADNALTAAELTRATFTVTDLSADELDFVLPLLPRGQSCILGITRAAASGYRIFAGFDHRVTEGREVAAFLGELRLRLQSFVVTNRAPVASAAVASAAGPAQCAYCDRSAAEAVTRGKDKGLLKMVGRDGREVLCCASCWNGW